MKTIRKIIITTFLTALFVVSPVDHVSAQEDWSNICKGIITAEQKQSCKTYQNELNEEIKNKEKELDLLEEKINNTTINLEKEKINLEELNNEIAAIDLEIVEVESEISEISANKIKVEAQIVDLEEEIDLKNDEIKETEKLIEESLEKLQEIVGSQQVNLYKNNYIGFIFGSKSFGELFQRISLIDKVAKQEGSIMSDLEKLESKLNSQIKELNDKKEKLDEKHTELERQLSLAEVKKAEVDAKHREVELLRARVEKIINEYAKSEMKMRAEQAAIEESSSVSQSEMASINSSLIALQKREEVAKQQREEAEKRAREEKERLEAEAEEKRLEEAKELADKEGISVEDALEQTPKEEVEITTPGLNSQKAMPPVKNFYVSAGAWSYPGGFLNGALHDGIDMAAPIGTPILAPNEMVIVATYSGCPTIGYLGSKCGLNNNWGGNQAYGIFLSEGKLYAASFVHMEKVNVKVGQVVSRGQQIGTMGSSGNSTGSHLHHELTYVGDLSISEYLAIWDGKLNFSNGLGYIGKNWSYRCENKKTAPCKQNPNDFYGLVVKRSY